ncbi:MAG: hypothetical protein BECKG1743D_GA0114223_110054 [Candidatus Kentron sp. G]|nr:MAG: hypothetical protein BECKG1743F_GA0114225_100235 [Candidatus Kentron sp. G]VFN06344.1 MAG: hypothetical protein BECKG1743E_GA0114224_110014 [Candidatus Kentron sp. G]VFN07200.1 MAG: hypothetical protein BECKG1743D_GA0114223_110054 [Candidatus Kentron sp. G]
MSTAVSVHLPDKLTFQLGGMASATGRSVSLVVQNAIEDYLEARADRKIARDRLDDPASAARALFEAPEAGRGANYNTVEEKRNGSALAPEDPIVRARGMLKGKKGGTALFLRDKQAQIEQEDRL